MLISTPWIGINCAAWLSSASAGRAAIQSVSTGRVSSSWPGGKAGKSLNVRLGSHGLAAQAMVDFSGFCDTF